MLSSRHLTIPALLCALAGCDSTTTSSFDQDLQNKVATVTGCMPAQIEKLDELLSFADLWRLNDGSNPADPSGLTWSEDGSGTISYSITLSAFSITGEIRFYSPAGAQFDATITPSPGGSLSQAIDDAATQVRAMFPSGTPFMVGEWNLAGIPSAGSVSSSGLSSSPAAFTGMIGTSQLEELRTTQGTAAVSGGPPPVQTDVITTVGSDTCVFSFSMSSLVTDGSASQQYPTGTITWTLANQTSGITLTGNLVFDGTAVTLLNVDDVGTFEVNIETRSVIAR
ncbi:MAG: hypothetical protein KDE27_33185 [Planctomycetes bacterium]|nr:hypothetical protein [Planctomycetota bacterium]